jgi:hypothetical protein
MALQRPSAVRRAAARSSVFNVAKNCSIEFRSGPVGRPKEEARAGNPDRLAHARHLVAAEVVGHRRVAGAQAGCQELPDMGAEAGGVDDAVPPPIRGRIAPRGCSQGEPGSCTANAIAGGRAAARAALTGVAAAEPY